MPLSVAASPLPFEAPLARGSSVIAHVEGASTRLELRAGSRVIEGWDVPFAVEDLTLEPETSGQRSLFVLRGRAGSREVAAILDPQPRPHVIWRGRLDLHGDPGERVADAIERRDVDGDGRPEIVLGERRDQVSACGEPPQLLFAHAIDARGALRPVEAIVAHAGLREIVATASTEATAPLLRGLRFTAASSQRGAPEQAVALGPPTGLDDGDAATGWAEGRGATGRGETLRGTWSGPPVTAIELRASSPLTMPSRLVLHLDQQAFVVTIPADARGQARITLPTATPAGCVSLTLDDDEARPSDVGVGFGEVTFFSTADGPGGVARLVDLLVSEASEGDRAVGWLAATGQEALPALQAAWERLGARGRRRALRAAAGLDRRVGDEGRAMVRELRMRAALDDDADVRADAVQALAIGGDEDRAALFEIARREPAASPLAASALARGDGIPEASWSALSALDHSLWDRAALRAAIARATMHHASWPDRLANADLDGYALAAIALGLAEATLAGAIDAQSPTVARGLLVRAISSEAARTEFVTRFRIARAARVVEDPTLDAWLETTARQAEEWMLRAEATEGLGERASRELLATLLRDPYPRVRLAAAHAVARRGHESATLLALARHDAWPLVRAYALGEIADLPEARSVLLDALRDPASAMRARALDLLRSRHAEDAEPGVVAILEDDHEWPHVTARAIEVADARCSETLGPALVHVVARGARAGAPAGDLETAQLALRAALRLGGASAEAARAATSGPSEPAFQVLLAHPQPPCGTGAPASSVPVDAQGVPSAR